MVNYVVVGIVLLFCFNIGYKGAREACQVFFFLYTNRMKSVIHIKFLPMEEDAACCLPTILNA